MKSNLFFFVAVVVMLHYFDAITNFGCHFRNETPFIDENCVHACTLNGIQMALRFAVLVFFSLTLPFPVFFSMAYGTVCGLWGIANVKEITVLKYHMHANYNN